MTERLFPESPQEIGLEPQDQDMMEKLTPYLAPEEQLWEELEGEKKTYIAPRRKYLGCVTIALLRETIAPVVFRNAEEEITDIEFNNEVYVRAVPNKFKYPERQRGLQILRACRAGGRQPQNRTVIPKGAKPGDYFDLNTLVFGDSSNFDNRVLPVRAAVNYSDGLSLRPKYECVEETFHNRAEEDGTLFNPEEKKNSENLFTRHFIKPSTLLLQVLSTRGRVLHPFGLQHLLLSIGIAGSYGGQTSVTGTNLRTHFVGIYADRFEPPESSPYVLLEKLGKEASNDVEAMRARLHEILSAACQVAIPGREVEAWLKARIEAFMRGELDEAYREDRERMGRFFNFWFIGKER